MKTKILFSAILTSVILLTNCTKNNDLPPDGVEPIENINFPAGFNFANSKQIEIELNAPDFLRGSIFEIAFPESTLETDTFLRGTFDNSGKYKMKTVVPRDLDSLIIESKSFGLEKKVRVAVVGNKAIYDYSIHYNKAIEPGIWISPGRQKSSLSTQFSYMGTYTAMGYPSYLFQVNDHAWESLLSNLNQTLPEGVSVPLTKPAFLESGKTSNLKLVAKTNVYVTFAGEGTDLTSALGYYLVNGTKPVDKKHIIIFPNASAPGSGGSLHSGDKVLLGEFPAGTEIGWFLVPNGWNKQNKIVTDPNGIYYSEAAYNPEVNANQKQHMVLLKDIQNEVIVLGFEDINRSSASCDNDFNDAVFYITLDQLSAADLSNANNTISPVDTDGDGIIDSQDQFPLDPDRAFINGGGSSSSGTLAFEDLWPFQGDYDFNDLVIDYLFNPITDANNLVKQLDVRLVIRNIGGSYRNGFGIEFPIAASAVESVTGTNYSSDYLNIAPNGVESGMSNAVVFPFDDGWNVRGQILSISIIFKTSIASSVLGTYPYNPFLLINGARGKEVHLPDNPPTAAVESSLFGTGADFSRPSMGLYYRSSQNLPWAINVINGYSVPLEKAPINYGYLKFVDWAKSAGMQFNDWNVDKPGYRDPNFLN